MFAPTSIKAVLRQRQKLGRKPTRDRCAKWKAKNVEKHLRLNLRAAELGVRPLLCIGKAKGSRRHWLNISFRLGKEVGLPMRSLWEHWGGMLSNCAVFWLRKLECHFKF